LNLLAPKPLLHLEGLAVLAVGCLLYRHIGASWGMFALLFFVPDLSMLGYLGGLRVGAVCYNLFHTYAVPLAVASTGYLAGCHAALCMGVIWAAHIGFDRMLGYGLKYETGFKDTHVGKA
jgi:hypothetical protein